MTASLGRRRPATCGRFLFVSQALRVFLVSARLGVVFTALHNPTALWSVAVGGLELTSWLIGLSAFPAAFAAGYFSVYTTSEPTLRGEFFEDTVAGVEQTLAVRAIYVARVNREPQ